MIAREEKKWKRIKKKKYVPTVGTRPPVSFPAISALNAD